MGHFSGFSVYQRAMSHISVRPWMLVPWNALADAWPMALAEAARAAAMLLFAVDPAAEVAFAVVLADELRPLAKFTAHFSACADACTFEAMRAVAVVPFALVMFVFCRACLARVPFPRCSAELASWAATVARRSSAGRGAAGAAREPPQVASARRTRRDAAIASFPKAPEGRKRLSG
jgi:hypothetical protein